MLMAYIKVLTNWYMAHMNYGTVALLMAMESTFLPVPSELVVPPAAWKAAQGDLNVFLVVLFGTIGCVLGALFNYCLAYYLGRGIIYKLINTKFAKMLFITEHSMVKAEKYFDKYGKSSTFIGRLVPGVRHLISIPAGLAKMNLKDFILYTALGSAIWNAILAALGYFLGCQEGLLEKYYKQVSVILLAIGAVFIAYHVYIAFKKKNNNKIEEIEEVE